MNDEIFSDKWLIKQAKKLGLKICFVYLKSDKKNKQRLGVDR